MGRGWDHLEVDRGRSFELHSEAEWLESGPGPRASWPISCGIHLLDAKGCRGPRLDPERAQEAETEGPASSALGLEGGGPGQELSGK